MTEIVVREMREEDIDGIMEIEHDSFAIPWTKQDLIGELSNTAARRCVRLCRDLAHHRRGAHHQYRRPSR